MAVDRPSILREAERLARQGRVHQAVQEYVRALEQDPRDATSAGRLADLYVQLGQPQHAMEHLMRSADALREAGESQEAVTLYERILTFNPQEPTAPAPTTGPEDLEDVFAAFRKEVEETSAEVHAEAQLLSGEALLAAGRVDEGLSAIEQAARNPRLRFRAAAVAARTYRQRGDGRTAVEWFERAAEAPAPGPEAGCALLYDLADTLEGLGEDARALANFLELRTEAGEYRDVTARIRRLSAART